MADAKGFNRPVIVDGTIRAHNPKAACSNHAPATTGTQKQNKQPTTVGKRRSIKIAEALWLMGMSRDDAHAEERRICLLAKKAARGKVAIATALKIVGNDNGR